VKSHKKMHAKRVPAWYTTTDQHNRFWWCHFMLGKILCKILSFTFVHVKLFVQPFWPGLPGRRDLNGTILE